MVGFYKKAGATGWLGRRQFSLPVQIFALPGCWFSPLPILQGCLDQGSSTPGLWPRDGPQSVSGQSALGPEAGALLPPTKSPASPEQTGHLYLHMPSSFLNQQTEHTHPN